MSTPHSTPNSDWAIALRAQLKLILIAASTLAGARVESEQNAPIAVPPEDVATKLPCLRVYLTEESSVGGKNGGPPFHTDAQIGVDVWAAGVRQATPLQTAQEVAADIRDRLAAQVIDALIGNPEWTAQFEKVMSYSIGRGFVAAQTAITLTCAQIRIGVEFSSSPAWRRPERYFETFTMEAAAAPPSGADKSIDVIAQPPQEASS